MTMTVELGALEQVVDRLVRDGRYGSKSEVLRTGFVWFRNMRRDWRLCWKSLKTG